jgi:3-methyladenine DNA glycosylase AlkD
VTSKEILARLKSLANPDNVAGMARFGISAKNTLGVPMPVLRSMGKRIGRDHGLALELWASGLHEARILAALVDDPALVTEEQMEQWVGELDSWDVCDQLCSNLLDKTPMAVEKARTWSRHPETFVKRAGFVLMAALSVHDKKSPDRLFLSFLPLIRREAKDERNFVKKAVNWALRQIGKRNLALNRAALKTAEKIIRSKSPAARWIAADALRELNDPKILKRLSGKK